MAKANLPPSQKYLRECFDYDADTGACTWNVRPRHHFNTDHGQKVTNGKHSGNKITRTTVTGDGKTYRHIKVGKHAYSLHRLIYVWVTGKNIDPDMEIDHINGDGTDNRWSNLRLVTRSQNKRNMRKMTTNTSGITGVTWNKSRQKWQAQMSLGDTTMYLGRFEDFFEACCARKSAEAEYNFHPNHGQDRPL